ncbi:helix-turn-helix transcriptional regulator [[Mycobacterium] nativiensis]|uniref:LuxR C-terminal-related transcriptional regulator n=1 Tax=[Mycobacterium] nativiensis TaxID=2855503 RepID=A0ABU5XUQ7_9MYCO|nr:LuxR C-terminal-related transcriptional regulator [Mycolicibacter sp. MYC340]MEB3031508.1 LuxR C-terminal-related transcriptional regulator [Mycolicibacter sp. MYC340]
MSGRLSWPLVGRSGELHTLRAAVSAPDVSGAVVWGAAGVGKSRILRDVLSDLAQGREVRWAVCTSAARSVPLGAFAAWAPSGVTDTVPLVRGVIDALTAASPGPTVVGVDDVHLIDDLSAFVVHQIVQRGLAKVILTVRDDEPIPPAVHEIWSAGRFERLDLQPLSLDETAELLSTTLGGAVDSDATQRLWRLTRGNVLYLRNIVEQEVADGRMVQQRGSWRWAGGLVMPLSLIELLESRIGALPGPVSDVIDAVAVGEPIALAALVRITDAAAVEEADVRGLITVEPGAGGVQVRVAHPLYGEVRRTRAAATRLRRLRGLVAAELAAADDRDDVQVVVRRAALSLDSDLTPDVDLLVRAAHGAVWLADLALAERLAAAAIRAGGGPEPGFVRAHALSWSGRGEEAEGVLAAIDISGLTDGDRARLAFLRASNMLWALGEPDRAKEIIDDASGTVASQARSYIDAFLTVYWFAVDRPDAARQAAGKLDLDELPAVVGAEIAWVLAAIAADAGRVTEAVATAEAGYRVVARSLEAPHMGFNIADAHVGALLMAGRVNDAGETAERVSRQAEDLPGAAQSLGAAVAGVAALGAGRLDTASVLLERAAAGLSASHAIGWGYRYFVPSITALAMRGAVDAAAAALDALNRLRRPFRLLDCDRSLARAWVAAGQGAVSEAIAVVREAAATAASRGQFAVEVMCLQTAAQFGDRTGAARLRELEALVEGPRVGLAARFAAALRDGDAAEMAAVSQDFERMGDLVAAVDAAAQAATAYRRQELRGTALGCAARAGALAEQCGGANTPALREAAEPLPLTEREAEIVMLIGAGLTNRAIADRLTLSVRTVESHIYRAMLKTGTNGRDELAALRPRHR